jgi:heavy metal sensor kinase
MKPVRAGLSVRVRLTLWNVSVLAFVLIVLGGSLRYLVGASLTDGVEREMSGRAHRFANNWAQFGPMDNRPPQRRTGSPSSQNQDTHRPRIFDLNGIPFPSFEEKLPPWDQAAVNIVVVTGQDFYSTIRLEDENIRIGSYPLHDSQGKLQAVFQSSFRLTDVERGLVVLDTTLLTLFPIALVVAGVGGAFLTERALRPVREITQATDRIEAQNLSGRLSVTGRDEFSDLAIRFNRMLERLETAFERQRRFTADASHELRTPLTVIKANTSLALDDADRSAEGYRRTLTSIDDAADRMGRIVQDLLFLARSDADQLPLAYSLIPVGRLLAGLREHLPDRKTEGPRMVLITPDAELCIRGDSHHLSRALSNLLENARRHTPQSGIVTLSAAPDDSGKHVVITIQDTGEGIAPEHLPRLFERFYRADEARSRPRGGTGLGLSIVRTILEAHGGTIRLESVHGQGTTAIVTLPSA